MTTATPELKIEPKLPVLAFNFDQLKAWATALAEHYAAIVVTEDAIADVKRDMAELNKAKKAIDDARKETVRQVSAPIRQFEAQIKEVMGIFDAAYQRLSQQVRTFEEREKDVKAEKIRGIIADTFEARKTEVAEFPIAIQASWLNKTVSLKAVRDDVADIINQRVQTETMHRQAEQARQERIAAIEQAVQAANARTGLSLNLAGFMVAKFTSLDTPFHTVLAAIDDIAANSSKLTTPKQNTLLSQNSPASEPAQSSEKTMSIIITYTPANERAVNLALDQLKRLCSSYNSRTK